MKPKFIQLNDYAKRGTYSVNIDRIAYYFQEGVGLIEIPSLLSPVVQQIIKSANDTPLLLY
jgi:hypothetical protein